MIQHLRAAARDGFERTREIGLHQAIGGLEPRRWAIGRAARTVVHVLRLSVLVKAERGRAEDERAVPVHDNPITRKADRRLEQSCPRQLPESPMRELVRRDRARDGDRERALEVRVVLDRGPSVHA